MHPRSEQAAPFAEQPGLEVDDIVVKGISNATGAPGDSATCMKSAGQTMLMGAYNAGDAVFELVNQDLGRV